MDIAMMHTGRGYFCMFVLAQTTYVYISIVNKESYHFHVVFRGCVYRR